MQINEIENIELKLIKAKWWPKSKVFRRKMAWNF